MGTTSMTLGVMVPGQREPSIPEKVVETVGYLRRAHLVLDRLEGNPQTSPSDTLPDLERQRNGWASRLPLGDAVRILSRAHCA